MAWAVVVSGVSLLVVFAWIFTQILTQNGRLLLRINALENQLIDEGLLPPKPEEQVGGLPAGSVLNDFSLPMLAGGSMTLHEWRGRRVLLIFVHPDCSFSRDLLAELATHSTAIQDPLPIVISGGDAAANRAMFDAHPAPYPLLLQEGAEVQSVYRLRGTPTGYLVGADGATLGPALVGPESLLRKLRPSGGSTPRGHRWRPITESHVRRDGLKAGTAAPDFTLPKPGGGELSLREFRGRNILLVFSDPHCAPCMRLAPKLEEVHRSRADLRVLMVSRGSVEDNLAKIAELGLTFPIALQRHWEVSRDYAMFATPIGYLIDEAGILSSDVATGAESIFQLCSAAATAVGRTGL